jgi:hypothetical protein
MMEEALLLQFFLLLLLQVLIFCLGKVFSAGINLFTCFNLLFFLSHFLFVYKLSIVCFMYVLSSVSFN